MNNHTSTGGGLSLSLKFYFPCSVFSFICAACHSRVSRTAFVTVSCSNSDLLSKIFRLRVCHKDQMTQGKRGPVSTPVGGRASNLFPTLNPVLRSAICIGSKGFMKGTRDHTRCAYGH
ncbi:hypothetical protein EUTSA_v10026596mg [Eutrema salsugineum]|uniref:Uncharacterized protein n=1 Tax=Eutrema salsugineum TaxID=72664 RepID=V4LZW6_EUTSA|nr:hypothetical protein EUTSA_v10026596mg [Eutrema salsugineum]